MSTLLTVSAQNKAWKAQEDARILADAEEILKDRTRLSNAKKQAKIMVKEQEKNLKSIKKVSTVKLK